MHPNGTLTVRGTELDVHLWDEDLEEAIGAAGAVRGDSEDVIATTICAKLRERLIRRVLWSVAASGPVKPAQFDAVITETVYSDEFAEVLHDAAKIATQKALSMRARPPRQVRLLARHDRPGPQREGSPARGACGGATSRIVKHRSYAKRGAD